MDVPKRAVLVTKSVMRLGSVQRQVNIMTHSLFFPFARPLSRTSNPERAGEVTARRHRQREMATRQRARITALVAFGCAVAVLGSTRVAGNARLARARAAMEGSFANVVAEQGEFRRVNARFASWSELSERGVRLPARQVVQQSTADQTHWYLSLRDRNTGLICDRIGERINELDTGREAVCRTNGAAAGSGARNVATTSTSTNGRE